MVGCDRCLIVHTTYAQGSIEQRNDETAELAFTGTLCAPLSVAVVPINTRGGTMNNWPLNRGQDEIQTAGSALPGTPWLTYKTQLSGPGNSSAPW